MKRLLEAFALMPLHTWAESRNQSIGSLLHEQTGLSKARISQGNIDAVRPSTLRKMEKHRQELLEKRTADPEELAYELKKIATAPQTSSQKYGLLACWMHELEVLPEIPLPISKAVALTMDELLESLLAACAHDDLAEFKQVLLRHIGHHGLAVRAGEEPRARLVPELEIAELGAVEEWSQALSFTGQLVDDLYWDMISTLDVEWNGHSFFGLQCSPLFPLVMVRPQNGLLEGRVPSSKKNLFFQPSRRLLEFLYAWAYYIRYRKWPAEPPSPQTLASILFKPGQAEVMKNSDVSNYFDGSTKLTFDLACEHWIQMDDHFSRSRKDGQQTRPPFPMIMLALQWQSVMVLDKGKSFFLPDLEKYNLLWRNRREQWNAHQARQEKRSIQTGLEREEPIEWPAWMLN